jgi:predicted nucleic acid-binding protein
LIVLDTNVLSALMKRSQEPQVLTWLDRQPCSSIWTTSITILEICFGPNVLPRGRRRSALMNAFDIVLSEKSMAASRRSTAKPRGMREI